MKHKTLNYLAKGLLGIILISIFCLNFVLAPTAGDLSSSVVSSKDYYKTEQKIVTTYIDFYLPYEATHYWNTRGLDTYEIIVSNLSFKGYTNKIIKLTWQDERYSTDTIRINYTIVNGILTLNNIKPYSINRNSKLTFKDFKVELGNLDGYEYKLETNFSCLGNPECKLINISYPVYSWSKWEDIDLTKINPSAYLLTYTAIDDINVSACGTLSANTYYTLNTSITGITGSCFIIGGNNVTLDMQSYNISGDGNSQNDIGIDNTGAYDTLSVKNGLINNFGFGIRSYYGNGNYTNLTISANGVGASYYAGIDIEKDGDNNIQDVNININGSANSYGLVFLYDYVTRCDTNTIRNVNINVTTTATGYGVYLLASKDNLFYDSVISTSDYDVYVLSADIVTYSTNNQFLNVSYNLSKEIVDSQGVYPYSYINRLWYYRANVTDYNTGAIIEGANVTANNILGIYPINLVTGADGLTNSTGMTEYVNYGGARTYYSNYTIYAEKTSYATAYHYYNATINLNNLNDVFKLDVYAHVTNCMDLLASNTKYGLDNGLSTTGDCIIIKANNVTLDMNGFNITGDGGTADYGIDNSATAIYNLTTILNGSIYNFGAGVYSKGNNGIFNNLTISSTCVVSIAGTCYGIYLNGNSNSIQNSTIINCLATGGSITDLFYGIYLTASSNNAFKNIFINNITATQGNFKTGTGIYLLSSSLNNNFNDINIADTLTKDIVLLTTTTNNTFTNATYTLSKESVGAGCSMARKWYYTAFVNDSLGNNVNNANVTAYNITGDYQFNLTTDATGYTSQTTIIDYVNNAGTKTYYSNYTITATDSSGHQSSHSLNVTQVNNYQDKFQLSCWSWLNRLFDYPAIRGSDIDSALKEIFI